MRRQRGDGQSIVSLKIPNESATEAASRPRWQRALYHGENGVVAAALAVMVLLPCAEVLLRKLFKSGVPASAPMVQHLVLVVGMLGGALAARDGRLLSLSTLTHFLKGRALAIANVLAAGVAASITLFLCAASFDYVRVMKAQGKQLAFGLPTWPVQSLLVLGFAMVALRLVWHAGKTWRPRLATLLLAGAFTGLAVWAPVSPEQCRWPALGLLLVAIVAGAPIFAALGGATLILFWSAGEPISSIPLKHYQLTVNPTLPSIPLFTLAGYFLAEGGAARRFVRLFQAAFGHIRGGPAIVTVLVCAFFTSFTGASGVTILALGGLLFPVLLAAGYQERASLGILTGAGSLGLLFPPCLPPILYSIVASTSTSSSIRMEEMFQGGLRSDTAALAAP
jgi:TRAP-type C4-dicarboxylate transport system permease small subunit